MLKGVSPTGFYDFGEQQFPSVGFIVNNAGHAATYVDPSGGAGAVDDAIYGSDEFRMYAYKIKRCPRTRSHDWTECPYAHRGEKATRRDPRRYGYCAVACPAFRNGACHRGDACEFAHGVFEYWLHPVRYRTRACNAGRACQRKVCFFAHTLEQLRRSETKHRCRFAYRPVRMNGGDGGSAAVVPAATARRNEGSEGEESATWQPRVKAGESSLDVHEVCMEERLSGLLKSLSGMNINMCDNETSDLDLSHIDWISELVD